MKKIYVTLISLALTQYTHAQDTTVQKIDALLDAYTQLYKFNGSALIARHGKILLQKGYGLKDVSDGRLNDGNTVYQIASVTKQFTSTVVLKLAELKKLSLSDKLSKYFPGFPSGDTVTIENLLRHTSGINDHQEDISFNPADDKAITNEEKLLTSIRHYGLEYAPGSRFLYSNKGYQLLGHIIEKVSGITYYEAIRKYIFTPLNMDNSGFDFIHLTNKDKATGYYFLSDSSKPGAPVIDSLIPFSAGSIYSTLGDLYKWHEGLENYKIINKASLAMAYSTSAPNPHYGYGWIIDTVFNHRIISHSGDIWGFKSNIARVTDDDVCIALLNNIEDPDLGIITKKILAILYNQPYQLPAKNQVKLGDEMLKKYVGSYEMKPGMIIEITVEKGHLIAKTDRKQELYAEKENVFLLDDGNMHVEVTFETDNLFFYKMTEKIVCKKIK